MFPSSRYPLSHLTLSSLLVLLLQGTGAYAQTFAGQLPSAADPGRELPQPAVPLGRDIGGAISVSGAPASQAPAGAENYKLTLQSVTVEGATVYPAEVLQTFYQGVVGKEVTVADLFRMANAIELRYRNDGYITSQVVVPAQTIEGGQFRLQVLEGFVAEIVYPDDIGPALAAVKQLVEPVRHARPVNVKDLERQLLLANDLAGVIVRASLQASPTVPGGSVVVVNTQRQASAAVLNLSNRNSPYMGEAQLQASMHYNAFGSRADTAGITARLSHPFERSKVVGGSYQMLLSEEGLTAGINGSYSLSEPGLELEELGVESRVYALVGTLTYPWLRSRIENLRWVGEFEVRDVNTDVGGDLFTHDKFRIVRTGISYDLTDDWRGITAVRAMFHQGLDILGATEQDSDFATREGGRSDFSKLTLDVTRVQQLPEPFSLVATFTAQRAFAALLASEEVAFGGPNFGRAFDEGEVSGEQGMAGVMELRYTPAAPAVAGLQATQFYGVADRSLVWNTSSGRDSSAQGLTSFGVGARAAFAHELFANLEVDKPLNRDVQTEGNNNPRVFLTITSSF